MVYGLMGVVIAEAAAIILLCFILNRMVSDHLRLLRHRDGIPDDKRSGGTRVISPYKKRRGGGDD